jgi:hypothetical protein
MAHKEIGLIEHLHGLATECVNAVLAVTYQPYLGGFPAAMVALARLKDAVHKIPPLPLADDPFLRQEVVNLEGLRATSAHAAAFALAKRTWDAMQTTVLKPHDSRRCRDPKGNGYWRITQTVTRLDPTENFSPKTWQEFCQRLSELPRVDYEQWQAELHLEVLALARRRHQEVLLLPAVTGLRKRPGVKSRPKKARGQYERRRLARDRWVYRKCCARVPHKKIVAELKTIAAQKKWPVVGTSQGIRHIAIEFAAANALPPPSPRRSL